MKSFGPPRRLVALMKENLKKQLRIGIGILLLAGVPIQTWAHGDTHGMVQAVTEELKIRPRDAELYYRRGELHRRHADWDLAWADFEKAEFFSTNLSFLNLSRGLLLAEAKWPLSARGYLDRFLATEPKNVAGLTARARVFLDLKEREAAVKDFDAALKATTDPRPEIYLERAQALVTPDGTHLKDALTGIEQGIQKLGGLVTLQLQAIDLELKLGQTNAALSRLDQIISQSPRKETWQARRGELLLQSGQWKESREAFALALQQLQVLPASRRNVPAMQELEKRIQAAIASADSHLKP